MFGDQLFVTIERGAGFVAKLFDLVTDALFGARDGALNGGIDLGDGFVKLLDALFHLAKIGVEFARKFFGNGGIVHAIAKRLRAAPDIFDLETILLQDAFGFGIDKSEIGAGKNHGHAAEKFFVEDLGLRVIGDFGGATKIGDSGKKKVLDDGAEQSIGAEIFRGGFDAAEPALAGIVSEPLREIAIGGGDDLALPFFHGKENRAVGSDFDLDFVARVFEFLAALEKKVVQFVAMGERIFQERRGDFVKPFVERIEKN